MFRIETYYYHLQQGKKVMYISYLYQFSAFIKLNKTKKISIMVNIKYLHFKIAGLWILVVLRRGWADVDHGRWYARHRTRREHTYTRYIYHLRLAISCFFCSQSLKTGNLDTNWNENSQPNSPWTSNWKHIKLTN